MKKIEGVRSGDFYTLKDKESFVALFLGDVKNPKEPVIRTVHFFPRGSGKKPLSCLGTPECPGCKAGIKPTTRSIFNVLAVIDDKVEHRLIEFSKTVHNQLCDLFEDVDNTTTFVKIKRSGEEMNDTQYTLIPQAAPPKGFTAADVINSVTLADLTRFVQPDYGVANTLDNGVPEEE